MAIALSFLGKGVGSTSTTKLAKERPLASLIRVALRGAEGSGLLRLDRHETESFFLSRTAPFSRRAYMGCEVDGLGAAAPLAAPPQTYPPVTQSLLQVTDGLVQDHVAGT